MRRPQGRGTPSVPKQEKKQKKFDAQCRERYPHDTMHVEARIIRGERLTQRGGTAGAPTAREKIFGGRWTGPTVGGWAWNRGPTVSMELDCSVPRVDLEENLSIGIVLLILKFLGDVESGRRHQPPR